MDNKQKSTKKKKSNKKKYFMLAILFILLFAVGYGGTYFYSMVSGINTNKISKDDESLGINDSSLFPDDVLNIALFGVDQRQKGERGRSDSIMVVSIDKKHDKLKLISIMRDSYVNIDGHGKDKLNHAYAFGGPELAIKTLNQTYGLNIKNYAAVNFQDLAHIIDELGGVEMDIHPYEVKEVNKYIADVAAVTGLTGVPLQSPGVQHLSGVQAVAYSRIRYVGNGDYERTDRQRRVLEGILNKISNLGITEYPSLVKKLLPYVETSLSTGEMIKIGTSVFTSGIKTIEQVRFPLESCSEGKIIKGVWYLLFDQEKTKQQIHEYIYNDTKPKEQ